jgi:hypothetical protein
LKDINTTTTFNDVFNSAVTFKIYSESNVLITARPVPAGVYKIVAAVQLKSPIDYAVTLNYGTLYVNPKGQGAKKLKPSLDCIEQLPAGHASGFRYVAHFACENSNSSTVFVPVGPDNSLVAQGNYKGCAEGNLPSGKNQI